MNHWWSQLDLANSAEFDGQGKLNRRLWLVEQKNTALEKQIGALKKEHEEELTAEMAVAAGLRDRIGVLDEKVRKWQETSKAEERAKTEAQTALRITEEQHATSGQMKNSDWVDIRAALLSKKAEVETLKVEVNKLAEEKRSLQEQIRQRQQQQQPAPTTLVLTPSKTFLLTHAVPAKPCNLGLRISSLAIPCPQHQRRQPRRSYSPPIKRCCRLITGLLMRLQCLVHL